MPLSLRASQRPTIYLNKAEGIDLAVLLLFADHDGFFETKAANHLVTGFTTGEISK